MADGTEITIREMTRDECFAVLSGARVAHLACASDGQPYVVPVYVALAGDCLYSFSMLGQKIDWMRSNPKVCLQITEAGEMEGWRSVVVFGRYEELPDRIGWKRERDRAWQALSKYAGWWEPGGLKPIPGPAARPHSSLFYRIGIDEMTGREAFGYALQPRLKQGARLRRDI